MSAIGMILGYPAFLWLGTASIFLVLLLLLFIVYVKTRRFIVSIFLPLVVVGLSVLSNYIILVTLSSIFSIELTSVMMAGVSSALLISLLMLTLCFLVRRIISKYNISNLIDKRYLSIVVGFLSLTIVFFYFNILIMQQIGHTTESIRLTLLLFSGYIILFLLILWIIIRVTTKSIQADHDREQLQHLQTYTDQVEAQYRTIRNFRHDYINILLSIAGFLKERDLDKLQHYFETEILPTKDQLEENNHQLGALSNINILQAKGLISSKIIQAQVLGIKTIVDIPSEIETLAIKTTPLSRILGIILDNAIEESEQCDEPLIQLGLLKKDNTHLIIVKNNCRTDLPNLSQLFKEGYSTKGENRGLGLNILKELIDETPNATLDTEIKHQQFIQKITIHNV